MNEAIKMIEDKIEVYAEQKRQICAGKQTKSAERKFDEIALKQEALQEMLDEILEAEKAPAQVEEVKEEKKAAPAKSVYDAVIAQYGEDVIMNNKSMINRIKRETLKEVELYADGSGRFYGEGIASFGGLKGNYYVKVEWVKKYKQWKVMAG